MDAPRDTLADGRRYPLDRVTRHFGSDPRYKCSLLQSNAGSKATISRSLLQTSSTDHRVEIILNGAKQYWSVILTRNETSTSIRAKRRADCSDFDLKDVSVDILASLKLILQGEETRGHKNIKEMRVQFGVLFALEEPDLLDRILTVFTAKGWARYPKMFYEVAKQVYELCTKTSHLGPHHPLSIILRSLAVLAQSMDIFDELRERVSI